MGIRLFLILITIYFSLSLALAEPPATTTDLTFNPAVNELLKQYQPLTVSFDLSDRSAEEILVISKLIEAGEYYIDTLFWRQSAPSALAWRERLHKSLTQEPSERNATLLSLLSYLRINAGPYDRLAELRPFLGNQPRPLGGGFYPADMSKEEFENYLASHPKEQKKLLDPLTVVERRGKEFRAVPFNKAYAKELQPAAKLLREAAALTSNASLKKFLNSRAKALLNNDYYQSDVDWINLDSSIETIFGPYETIEDGLMNLKAAFEVTVALKDAEATAKLQIYKNALPELEKTLPYDESLKPKSVGKATPIVVVNDLYRAGDFRKGMQWIATTLPNDPKVRETYGSKKVLIKNMIEARGDTIMLPIAKRLVDPKQQALIDGESIFQDTLMHEVAHALGPQAGVNERLQELSGGIEEAKADVVGLFCLREMTRRELFTPQQLQRIYLSSLASILRTVRFGITEPHGQAALMEFNYYIAKEALRFDIKNGTYSLDLNKFPTAVEAMAHDLLTLQGKGDYQAAKQFVEKYQVMPEHLENSLQFLKDLPVDFVPTFKVVRPLLLN